MTCIIGLEHEGNVYIGADSAAVEGWTVRQIGLHKVFRRGDFLIGYTTSFRMGQILQHHLAARAQKASEEDGAYMVCAFVEAVRECLREKAYTTVKDSREKGGCFLAGYSGKLYRVDGSFQVGHFRDGFDAVGSGAEFALGAMEALGCSMLPRKRIKRALRIAMHFSGSVRGPFKVMKL